MAASDQCTRNMDMGPRGFGLHAIIIISKEVLTTISFE